MKGLTPFPVLFAAGLWTWLLATATISTLAQDSTTPTNATNLPVGSCTKDIPCANGACCNGNSGFCGYGKSFCTTVANGGNCTSNCDALAECGEDAAPGNFSCPLNVCCSKFGFCGTTDDFCGDGCQGDNCGPPKAPSCGVDEQTALTRRIGYYEGWSAARPCLAYTPEQISAETLTHINFAFALISSDFKVVEMTPGDSDLWKRTTALKDKNPTLKVFLSIGGWSFNDPPTQHRFSELAASSSNTQAFIDSVLSVLESYGFDGIDVDWEYPVADDRGGVPADKENYVKFMAAVKNAFKDGGYGLTFTAPSSYWYLQHFDLPGLLKSADWVNVMTYDLHGVWDGKDPYIGYVLGAHTNLTEIDQAFDLFWRVGIDPQQVVMGMGFYGRSFTLVSPDCATAGCPWVSGAKAGPCSANSGTLMYSEIMSILQNDNVDVNLDEEAAVEYIVFDTNQWVSYDDAESFALKINYANERCIGGTMIWSIDQDDNNYSALKALYPNIDAAAGGVMQGGGSCKVTDCGVKKCDPGYTKVGKGTKSPTEPGKKCDRLICCPSGDPINSKNCKWRGGDSSPCSPNCLAGEMLLATQTCKSGGSEAYCCETTGDAAQKCFFTDCTSQPSCGKDQMIAVGIKGLGGAQSFSTQCEAETPQELLSKCPNTCSNGQVKPYCCDNAPVKNCKWHGSLPNCEDNACGMNQIQMAQDPQGDGRSPCVGGGLRNLCCEPQGDAYIPVPFDDLFPSDVTEGATTFDVEFDPDEGPAAGSEGAGTSSKIKIDEKENDEAFGEIFIDSPNPNAVSSLDLSSDWVITGCHPTSDQPQSVLAYCSKGLGAKNSGCAHVFIGGAEHTIVKMPSSCGRGPYARIASLVPHVNQNVLSAHHQAKKPKDEMVYLVSFDYNFAAIPESNGPVYMRADVTDLPGYWDEVVDSPPERREWMRKRELEKPVVKRWWGSFTNWLSKMNKVEKDTSTSRNFHWSDTWEIYHNEISCPGPPQFDASIDISVTGQAQFNSRYGFYLQGQVVPPKVSAAYLYFNADASASAQFTIDALASITYTSDTVQFASFGFPGLYYPGLLTLGPSLTINGYITGELSMQATLTTNVEYKFPSVSYSLGKSSPDQIGETVSPSGKPQTGYRLHGTARVEVEGDISIHLVPQVQMGISVLGGAVIDAQAFVRSDLYAGATINGSVSDSSSPEFCFAFYYGVDFDGGLTGSVLYWETGPIVWPFYSNRFTAYDKCFDSITEPSGMSSRDLSSTRRIETFSAQSLDDVVPIARDPRGPAMIKEKRNAGDERVILPETVERSPLKVRGVPFLPGALNCPEINDEIGQDGKDDDPYSDLESVTSLEDAFERREVAEFSENVNVSDVLPLDADMHKTTLYDPKILVSVRTCNYKFSPRAYSTAVSNTFYNLERPQSPNLDPSYDKQAPGGGNIYNREHVYEVQLLSMFIDYVAANGQPLWDNGGPNDFCNMVRGSIAQNLIPNLVRCLPYDKKSPQTYMPWLERVTNGLKAQAINGQTLRSQKTFNNYAVDKKVAIMRAAVGVLEYMEIPAVQTTFIEQSKCVRDEWVDWLNNHWSQDPAAPVGAGNVNIAAAYNDWIKNRVMDHVGDNIFSGLSSMIGYWDTTTKGKAVAVHVDLPNQLQNGPIVQVDTASLVNNLQNQVKALTWTAQLLV